ncbi:hypothetical protein SNEBB_006665, partial [Seison nebaliae]
MNYQQLLENSVNYLKSKKLFIVGKNGEKKIIPIVLLPFEIKKTDLENGRSLQQIINRLYSLVASDDMFIEKYILDNKNLRADKFVDELSKIYEKTKNINSVELTLFRSDYFFEEITNKFKQIEVNTIASGAMAVTPLVHECQLSNYRKSINNHYKDEDSLANMTLSAKFLVDSVEYYRSK